MSGLRDVIERRVNLFGVGEPVVTAQISGTSRRLAVELPGIHDINQAIEMIGKTPFLEFKEERPKDEEKLILERQEALIGKTIDELTEEELELVKTDPFFISTILTGQYLKRATISLGQTTFEPAVVIEFNDEGKDLFKEITERNIGKKIAIYIDDVLISAPVVNEVIEGGSARITGS